MRKIVYNCIEKYWYYKYIPVSCNFWEEFDNFTQKYHIFDLFNFPIGILFYIILWTTHVQNVTPLHPQI